MSSFDAVAASHALARAQKADEKLWSDHRSGSHIRRQRDLAVFEALSAGMSREQVADELGVLISDVERMASTACPH
ncbi:MAG: hypothetical protein WAL50_07605 [Kineosporiaceae bacterium]|jgi:FixJ family two-component response regulator